MNNTNFNRHQFESCSLVERIQLLQKCGEYLTHIRENNNFVDLYCAGNHLIEVIHNMNLFNIQSIEIVDIKDPRLELYAQRVNISDLYTA